jgi:ABC-type transport system substrate-binding protein
MTPSFKIVVGAKVEETIAESLKGNLEETIIPRGKTDEVRTDPHYRQYRRVCIPIFSLLYLGFNTQRWPFNNSRVHQAFNYAVDTEAIVREITKIGNLPVTEVLPPGSLGYDPDPLGLPSHGKG